MKLKILIRALPIILVAISLITTALGYVAPCGESNTGMWVMY